jgi:hypothetical protein
MLRAWAWGVLILVACNAGFGVLLPFVGSAGTLHVLMLVAWVSSVMAAFVVAFLAPRKRVQLGISMAVPAALVLGAVNELWHRSGRPTDLSGAQGWIFIAVVGVVWNLALCAPGAVAGAWLAKRQGHSA